MREFKEYKFLDSVEYNGSTYVFINQEYITKKANEIAQAMISLLNEKTTSKECDAVISFMIEFRNVLSDDSVNMLFDTLNAIPEGKQALQECNLTNSDSIRNYID